MKHTAPTTQPVEAAWIRLLIGVTSTAGLLTLAGLVLIHELFFAVRSMHLLQYPFPLDYGEGPLLAQIQTLRAGTPIWELYSDPSTPPYAVVNYPPLYHALSALTSLVTQLGIPERTAAILLAGRLVSLGAGLLCIPAIALLARWPHQRTTIWATLAIWLIAGATLGIPIVREWSSVLRVDVLGVCLGLWGLVVLVRGQGSKQLWLVALLLALSLLTKPSLVAAPAAACAWLLLRTWRRGVVLIALLGVFGGIVCGLLMLASNGWFWTHVVVANANAWDRELARGFWRDQMLLMQPLLIAGGLVLIGALAQTRVQSKTPESSVARKQSTTTLPLFYTLFGMLGAFGVGKLGAYTNYFLEAYVGLFWLAASGIASDPSTRRVGQLTRPLIVLLVAGSLLRYYPLWSEEYLLPAGIIEGRNPIRFSIGGYGVWQDLQREAEILAARSRINQALAAPIQAAGAPIFTDIPGVAAQAGAVAREQVFEHRMLYDAGKWDQRPLLRDLATGNVPLVVLDYLGNWLTPEQITLITRRYAQDLSIGPYTIYRPVDPGASRAIDLHLPGGLQASALALTQPSDGGDSYAPGEILAVTLTWISTHAQLPPDPTLHLQLSDRDGQVLLTTSQPFLNRVLGASDLGTQGVQQMLALTLPAELPAGTYQLAIALGSGNAAQGSPANLGTITVAEGHGQILGADEFYLPARLLGRWQALGGLDGPGAPITPAVPFVGFIQQCFERACLRWQAGSVTQLPVGEMTWLADQALPRLADAPRDGQLSPALAQLYQAQGGAAVLGPLLGGERKRFGDRVQYTRYARLEQPLAGGPARLGSIGIDVLRLPGGTRYYWPAGR